LLVSVVFGANSTYTRFIDEQMKYIAQMNDGNVSQSAISDIVDKQEESYNRALEDVMMNKASYIEQPMLFKKEILRLEKIISINKRAGNKYAVLRDEIKIKSYKLLRSQNQMIRDILSALDYSSSSDFSRILDKTITANQLANQDITSGEYDYIFELKGDSKTIKDLKKNAKELKMLIEINIDLINHLYAYEGKMYSLNKYANYNLLGVVLFINNIELVKVINLFLQKYHIDIMKIVSILSIFILIYFFKKVFYIFLDKYLHRLKILQKYSNDILQKIRKPLEIIIFLINIELIIYVYSDFIVSQKISKFFNVSYAFFIMWLIYRVINVVATIKIAEINLESHSIKNEMINIGIKIVNFIIVTIGLLLILYFAGVNLTAVLSGLGIGGFAVAFAAKDTLSNFFGTLSILFSDMFSQGDWIEVDGKEGTVIEIGLRVTTLRTFDNAVISIPNSVLTNNEVKNWNKRIIGRRIKMKIGIKYNSPYNNIKQAISEIRDMLEKHPDISTEHKQHRYTKHRYTKLVSQNDFQGIKKTLLVYLDEFADSSINILIYCFSTSVKWEEWLATKEDVMYKIMEILEKNNLEFAFPSLSVYREN